MQVDQLLPRLPEQGNVQRFAKINNDLLNVGSGSRRIQMVKKHTLLHWRERIALECEILTSLHKIKAFHLSNSLSRRCQVSPSDS